MPTNESTTKLNIDISEFKKNIQEANRQIRLANAEFKAATASMDKWSDSEEGIAAQISKTTKVLEAQKSKLASYEKQLEEITKTYGENSKEAQEMLIKVQNQKAKVGEAEKALSNYDKMLEEVGDDSKEVASATDTTSEGFTVMKGALADLVASGIKLAIDGLKDLASQVIEVGSNFDSAMSKVEAVSGATSEEVEQLRDKAEEMGEKTIFSATQSAEAFNYMAMAGWKTEDMLEGIEGIMNLAAASGSDLATASDIVTDALTAMGYGAKDAGRLADVMAAASANANTNVEMMGSTFQYAAPIVGALGYSMEDTAVAIGLMANAGIKGDKAGTALRSTLTRLSAPPKKCAEAMEALGISLTDEQGNMKDLSEVMGDLRNAFSNLEETQKTQYAKQIAGQEAMSGLLSIVSASTEDYNKLTEAVENSTGAAERMADTMNDNLGGQMTLLQSKIEGIMIKLFDSASDSMVDGIHSVSDALDLIDWDKVGREVGNFAKKAAEFFKYLVNNGPVVMSVLKNIGALMLTVFVVDKLGAYIGVVNKLITTYKTLNSATAVLKTTQLGLNAAQLASPVGLLTVAVAGLAAAYVVGRKRAKDFAEAEYGLTDQEKELNDSIEDNYESMKELNKQRSETIEATTGEFNYIKQLKDEYNSLVDENGKVKEGYEDRANFILNELSEALGVELENLQAEIDQNGKLGASIDELIQKKQAEATLSAYEDSYKEAKANEAKALEEAIKAQNNYSDAQKEYNDLLQRESDLKGQIQELQDSGRAGDSVALSAELLRLGDSLDAAKTRLDENKQALDQANQAYKDGQQTIKDYEGLSSAIVSGDVTKINEELEKLTTGFKDAKSSTEKELEEQVKTLQEKYNELKNAADNGSNLVTEEMLKGAQEMVDKAQAELDKFPGQAAKSANKAVGEYADTFGNGSAEAEAAAQKVKKAVYDGTDNPETKATGKLAIDEYNSGIESELSNSRQAGYHMAQEAKAGADTKDATTDSEASGSYFAEGFFNGIGSWLSKIFNRGKELSQEAKKGVAAGDGEGSPAKDLIQSGEWFAEGFEIGIKNGTTSVITAAYNMARKAASATSSANLGKSLASVLASQFASEEKSMISIIKGSLNNVLNAALNVKSFDFSSATGSGYDVFTKAIEQKISYITSKLSYVNSKAIEQYDNEIEKIKSEYEDKVARANNSSEDWLAELKKKYEDDKDELEQKISEITSISEDKRTLKQQQKLEKLQKKLTNLTNKYEAAVNKEEDSLKSTLKALENAYNKALEEKEALKSAYTDASEAMLSGLQDALLEYQTAAEELINSTMSGISDTYTTAYNALLNKQDTLISKLQSAGDLFNLSSANVMTLNDIQAQTESIKQYASKLKTIKEKVSSALFDEIASYDMDQGEAFIDRLLAMSEAELKAYSDAFDEKLNVSEELAKSIYEEDFDSVADSYASEIEKAFASLPATLEELGVQTIKGFLDGISSEYDYMDSTVTSIINSLVSEFKSQLGIHSPSKVTMKLGEYVTEGFADGILDAIKSVKSAVSTITDSVATGLDFTDSVNLAKNSIGTATGYGNSITSSSNTQIINFNQTNNSPKALDRLTVYRQTNNLLFQAKVGLSNV